MENTSNVRHFNSKQEYLNHRQGLTSAKNALTATNNQNVTEIKTLASGEKVEISDEAKNLNKINEAPKNMGEKISHDAKEISKATSHVAKDAASAAANIATNLIPVGDIVKLEPPKNSSVTKAQIEKKEAPIQKPGIFILEGLELLSFGGNDGLRELGANINLAENYSWQDEDKVVEEILKRSPEQPIVLIGHSLGGDAAVSIANKLNNIKSGFRKVNLLVTMDSVGFNNDIIPQNVQKNINYMLDKDYLFNDGPNVARNSKLTNVENVLTPTNHTEIDESPDVHFEILENINKVMDNFKQEKKLKKLTDMFKETTPREV